MSGGSGGSGGGMLGAFTGGVFDFIDTGKQAMSKMDYLKDLENSYNEDAKYQQRVGDRKLSLLDSDQKQYNGRLAAQLAQAGISFSGSAVDIQASTGVDQARERAAVKLDTDMRVNSSYTKASQARSEKNDINDSYQGDMAAGFLGGGAKGYQSWGGK